MLNQAQIIGHLGKDPDVRYMPNGDPVTTFSVATTDKWKDKASGQLKEATEWHRIVAYGRLAEICGEYLRKGSLAFVQGKIATKKWTDKEGIERYTTEIRAESLRMLSGRPDSLDRPAQGSAPSAPPRSATGNPNSDPQPANQSHADDDIPF